jgi:myo-inositol-1(or 4)-monophosphatase
MNTLKFLDKVRSKIQENIHDVIALRNERSLKSDLSFVTHGDLLINTIIEDMASEEGADIVVVSEEKINAENLSLAGFVIVVDPIDGTENFTSGFPMWGVSVSCYFNGVHQGSLLGCPEMNLWLKSGDTFPKFFSRVRGLSSSLNMDDLIKSTQGHEYRILGCCVYNMINVIRGSFLSFENPKGAHSWDILAGLNIALENKLKVIVDGKPYEGEYLPPNRKYKFSVQNG